MKTVRFESSGTTPAYYSCNETGDHSSVYVSKEDHDAEVTALKQLSNNLADRVYALEAENNALREDAALFKADADMWKGIADRTKGQLAELREAVAWYIECHNLWCVLAYESYPGYSGVPMKELQETLKIAGSEIKRLAEVG